MNTFRAPRQEKVVLTSTKFLFKGLQCSTGGEEAEADGAEEHRQEEEPATATAHSAHQDQGG